MLILDMTFHPNNQSAQGGHTYVQTEKQTQIEDYNLSLIGKEMLVTREDSSLHLTLSDVTAEAALVKSINTARHLVRDLRCTRLFTC